MNKYKDTIFNTSTENVLARGLNAMTKACDSLTKQNEQLNKDIEGLKRKIDRLQERVLVDAGERQMSSALTNTYKNKTQYRFDS